MATLEVTVQINPVVMVSNNGATVTIFNYGKEKGNTRIDFRRAVPYRRNQRGERLEPTSCMVDNSRVGMGFGRADCSPHDHYSVDVGRKLALSRALEHFPREFREDVWKAVFETGVIRQ